MFQKNKDNTIINLGVGAAILSSIFSIIIIRLLLDIKQTKGNG
jgi:hypothetical protein